MKILSKLLAPLLACFAILHDPDGHELRFDINQIAVQRSAEHSTQLHHAVSSVIYSAGQKFGVVESLEQIREAIHNCIDGQ